MKIRQIIAKTLKLLGCTTILALVPAFAGEQSAAEEIGAEVSVGYDTDYVFRGTLLGCLLYTSPSPRDRTRSRMPSSA